MRFGYWLPRRLRVANSIIPQRSRREKNVHWLLVLGDGRTVLCCHALVCCTLAHMPPLCLCEKLGRVEAAVNHRRDQPRFVPNGTNHDAGGLVTVRQRDKMYAWLARGGCEYG